MAVSGNPPLRDHSSETQAGSLLLSWHQKCSLAKILPSVVKPLEVRNVCWELCCADELRTCWLPSCRSWKGMKAWGRGSGSSGWVGGCLSVFQQVHPKASEIPCDSSPSQSGTSYQNILFLPLTHLCFTVPELPAPKLLWVASARAWFTQMGMSKCR